jgi:surface protein
MKKKIIAKSRNELSELIYEEIQANGLTCDLNHIDVSRIWNMDGLFSTVSTMGFNGNISEWDVSNVESMYKMFINSEFNGDISKWDISKVQHMTSMFYGANFNGDISQWNTSKVENMQMMFYKSQFNGDISKWDVSNVKDMNSMFAYSEFSGDISDWDVSNVLDMNTMFFDAKINCDLCKWKPYSLYISESFPIFKTQDIYWAKILDLDERRKAIDSYWMQRELKQELSSNNKVNSRLNIGKKKL